MSQRRKVMRAPGGEEHRQVDTGAECVVRGEGKKQEIGV